MGIIQSVLEKVDNTYQVLDDLVKPKSFFVDLPNYLYRSSIPYILSNWVSVTSSTRNIVIANTAVNFSILPIAYFISKYKNAKEFVSAILFFVPGDLLTVKIYAGVNIVFLLTALFNIFKTTELSDELKKEVDESPFTEGQIKTAKSIGDVIAGWIGALTGQDDKSNNTTGDIIRALKFEPARNVKAPAGTVINNGATGQAQPEQIIGLHGLIVGKILSVSTPIKSPNGNIQLELMDNGDIQISGTPGGIYDYKPPFIFWKYNSKLPKVNSFGLWEYKMELESNGNLLAYVLQDGKKVGYWQSGSGRKTTGPVSLNIENDGRVRIFDGNTLIWTSPKNHF